MQTYSAIIFDTLIRILRFWFISFNAFVDWNNQWIIASISIYHALTSETAFLNFFLGKTAESLALFIYMYFSGWNRRIRLEDEYMEKSRRMQQWARLERGEKIDLENIVLGMNFELSIDDFL